METHLAIGYPDSYHRKSYNDETINNPSLKNLNKRTLTLKGQQQPIPPLPPTTSKMETSYVIQMRQQ